MSTNLPTYRLSDLAHLLSATLRGDADCQIRDIASFYQAEAGHITFVADVRYAKRLAETNASAILLDPKVAKKCDRNVLIMPNPRLGFIKLIELFRPSIPLSATIDKTAVIDKSAIIDKSAYIGPQAVIAAGVKIGANTVIEAGVTIGEGVQVGDNVHLHSRAAIYHHCVLGDRTIIHSGAVIGADGFGFAMNEKRQWIKVPQVGRVIIGHDVEIGANTTIDRGNLDDTVIGNGVKIDNLVMIGHNVQIGDHTIIAGCAGIAGSTKIGSHCMIGAAAGINGHIEICDGAVIGGMGMIQKSITEPGIYSSGTGMQPNQEWHKSVIRFRQLDDMAKRLQRLERKYDERDGSARD